MRRGGRIPAPIHSNKKLRHIWKERTVAATYKWKIEDIYPNDDAWESAYADAEKTMDFGKFAGTLGTAAGLRAFFAAQESTGKKLERLYLYAHMKHDEDTRIAKYTAMQSRAMALYVRFSSECSFAEPELSALDEGVLKSYLQEESLKDYDYFLRSLLRNKKYVLSAAEEKLLAAGGEVYAQFQNIFSMIDNADLSFGEIEDGAGNKIALTHGTYGVILHGTDRELRKRAFAQYYAGYISLQNTIAATYFGNVKKDVFLSQARGYSSCLQRALSGEDVAEVVYSNLIDAVHGSLPTNAPLYRAARKAAQALANSTCTTSTRRSSRMRNSKCPMRRRASSYSKGCLRLAKSIADCSARAFRKDGSMFARLPASAAVHTVQGSSGCTRMCF